MITFPRTVFHQFVDEIVNDLRPDGGFSVEGAALSGLLTATEDHLHFVFACKRPSHQLGNMTFVITIVLIARSYCPFVRDEVSRGH